MRYAYHFCYPVSACACCVLFGATLIAPRRPAPHHHGPPPHPSQHQNHQDHNRFSFGRLYNNALTPNGITTFTARRMRYSVYGCGCCAKCGPLPQVLARLRYGAPTDLPCQTQTLQLLFHSKSQFSMNTTAVFFAPL